MRDADSSSFFLGDESSFPKKEAELAKRLICKDETPMTVAQSKKMSQMIADNSQWVARQLLRSGAVRGTEVQTEFDDEDERKVILLVHAIFKTQSLHSWMGEASGACTAFKRSNIGYGYYNS